MKLIRVESTQLFQLTSLNDIIATLRTYLPRFNSRGRGESVVNSRDCLLKATSRWGIGTAKAFVQKINLLSRTLAFFELAYAKAPEKTVISVLSYRIAIMHHYNACTFVVLLTICKYVFYFPLSSQSLSHRRNQF